MIWKVNGHECNKSWPVCSAFYVLCHCFTPFTAIPFRNSIKSTQSYWHSIRVMFSESQEINDSMVSPAVAWNRYAWNFHWKCIPWDGKPHWEGCFPLEQTETAVAQLGVVSSKAQLGISKSVRLRHVAQGEVSTKSITPDRNILSHALLPLTLRVAKHCWTSSGSCPVEDKMMTPAGHTPGSVSPEPETRVGISLAKISEVNSFARVHLSCDAFLRKKREWRGRSGVK